METYDGRVYWRWGSSYNTNHSETIGLVRKYLQGTDYEGEDRNPWAVAYYCLRCGAYDDAINVFKQVISRSNNYDWSGTNIANEPEHIVSGLEAWRSCFAAATIICKHPQIGKLT